MQAGGAVIAGSDSYYGIDARLSDAGLLGVERIVPLYRKKDSKKGLEAPHSDFRLCFFYSNYGAEEGQTRVRVYIDD
mgnify:CR=1 FL=1